MRRTSLLFSTFIVLCAGMLFALPLNAQGDVSAPVLVALDIQPSWIDTSLVSQTVSVTARFTDDLSGFHDSFIVFVPQDGTTQSTSAYFSHAHLESGTLLDGIYQDTLTLPRYASTGWWIVQQVSLVDQVGNRKDYFVSSVDGFPHALQAYRFYNGPDSPPPDPLLLWLPQVSTQ